MVRGDHLAETSLASERPRSARLQDWLIDRPARRYTAYGGAAVLPALFTWTSHPALAMVEMSLSGSRHLFKAEGVAGFALYSKSDVFDRHSTFYLSIVFLSSNIRI
jgi:hypothetical protein